MFNLLIINGIINNAGVRQRKKFDIISQKEVNDIFEINFFSIFKIMQTYVKYCKKLKIKSSIVNIGSIVGETGFS